MGDRIKETDWKTFKELRPLALQRYCERVMVDVDEIIHDNEGGAHKRYIEMYQIVHDGDKKLAQMFDGFSRSKALSQLAMYCAHNLLNDEEIARLSEETRKKINAILEIWKEDKA